jgi:hypothetical protein
MTNKTAVAATSADDLDATIADALFGVTAARERVHSPNAAWLDDLAALLLPYFPRAEARVTALLLIADNTQRIHERAIDLLVEQVKADPSLQEFIDRLSSDDDGSGDANKATL